MSTASLHDLALDLLEPSNPERFALIKGAEARLRSAFDACVAQTPASFAGELRGLMKLVVALKSRLKCPRAAQALMRIVKSHESALAALRKRREARPTPNQYVRVGLETKLVAPRFGQPEKKDGLTLRNLLDVGRQGPRQSAAVRTTASKQPAQDAPKPKQPSRRRFRLANAEEASA